MRNAQTIGRGIGIQKSWPRYMILFYPFLCLSIFNFQLTILSDLETKFSCAEFCSRVKINADQIPMQKISAVRIGRAALTYH